MDLKSFYIHPTQGEVNDSDGQVKSRIDLDELLGISTVSMDFDVSSVEGEDQLQGNMQVQQVPNDTDPLMWWKQYSRVGLVQTDFHGRLLDSTMIDLMWAKQEP